MWLSVSDLSRKKPYVERNSKTLTAFLRAGGSGGSNLLMRQYAFAAGLLQAIWAGF